MDLLGVQVVRLQMETYLVSRSPSLLLLTWGGCWDGQRRTVVGGLISAPQIPAGFRSFRWIPEEYKLAEGSAKSAIPVIPHSGGILAFRN
jgi:hypothetical protein